MVAKLCACAGALISELPYEALPGAATRMGAAGNRRGSNDGGSRDEFEGSLGALMAALAKLMMEGLEEPSVRIGGAFMSSFCAVVFVFVVFVCVVLFCCCCSCRGKVFFNPFSGVCG